MTRLCLVLGDQLSERNAVLNAITCGSDHVLMAELVDECDYVWHHRKKIVMIFSAMRHFARSLESSGHKVFYHRFDPDSKVRSFSDAVTAHCAEHEIDQLLVTWPGEWRVLDELRKLADQAGLELVVLEDDRFLCRPEEFSEWARGRRQLRMEFFYRQMRRRTGYLMDGDAPAGGKWNLDVDNRKAWPGKPDPGHPMQFTPDQLTVEVIELVSAHFDGFGDLDGFDYPVTRAQARRALSHFVSRQLAHFGSYQDAMHSDSDYLFHSRLSAAMNIGLLEPAEVCDAVQAAWEADQVPLNAAEGFIRQVIGWREYVRGVYWLKMPDYAELNHFDNQRSLPSWYWTGEVKMNCLRQTISATRRNAYAHHIQRLMVTGNFALLAGVVPSEICDWYLAVYIDAFDWVELPNTLGMVMHADGGLLASKPYAASGRYIQRMSNYCQDCPYRVDTATEQDSCPFNALYWHFLMRHRDRLGKNPRMGMMYRNLDRQSDGRKSAIGRRASWLLENIESL